MSTLTENQQKEYSEAYKIWLRKPVFVYQPWTPIMAEVEAVVMIRDGKVIPEEVLTVLAEKEYSDLPKKLVKKTMLGIVGIHNGMMRLGERINMEDLLMSANCLLEWFCRSYMKDDHFRPEDLDAKKELFDFMVEKRSGDRVFGGPFNF